MLRAGARHPDASDEAPSTSGGGVQQLYAVLHEYLQLEGKLQPKLCLSPDSEQSAEVSRGARDGAAHVMRCLKVWFELPADVLLHAVNLFDRFLTKMRVRPCHVPCITVACVDIAVEAHARAAREPRAASVDDLVSISQSTCTARDVRRMAGVIGDKLSLAGGAHVTSVHWLRLLSALLAPAAHHAVKLQESELLNLLEITACDYTCANSRPSELALVLLYHNIEKQLVEWSRVHDGQPLPDDVYRLYEYAVHLQNICHMSDASLLSTKQLVSSVLARYEARAAAPHRQRLLWRLSERTLRVLRPTDRLTSLLPTIAEQNSSSPPRDRPAGEGSEETSDWPRSPLLPVYCDN